MTQWWTYRLSDFLMFSPRTYARLVEGYNAALWPAQAVVLAIALLVLWRTRRWAGVIFALAWVHVGWAFFATRYAEIFTASTYLAVACGVQAVLMLVVRGQMRSPWLTAAAVLLYPLASTFVLDRTWRHAEVFGFMPDPTAVASIVLALTLRRSVWVRLALCLIPVVVLLFGWGTLVNLHGV